MSSAPPPTYEDALEMESVEPEDAPPAEQTSYYTATTTAIGNVVYPEGVVEGSPAWHAANAASSAATSARQGAAAIDERYKISDTLGAQQKAAYDKMAALDAEHKISEKTTYAYEQTKAGTFAAMQATQGAMAALDQQHNISGRTSAALAGARAQSAALDEKYKVSETVSHYDSKYNVSQNAYAAASTTASAAASAAAMAHAWWTGKPAAASDEASTAEADDAACEEAAAAEAEPPDAPVYRSRAESEGQPL